MSESSHKQLGFIGFDQYGNTYHLERYPRKELLEQLYATRAEKMFCCDRYGQARHIGYVIKDHWVRLYRICDFKNNV